MTISSNHVFWLQILNLCIGTHGSSYLITTHHHYFPLLIVNLTNTTIWNPSKQWEFSFLFVIYFFHVNIFFVLIYILDFCVWKLWSGLIQTLECLYLLIWYNMAPNHNLVVYFVTGVCKIKPFHFFFPKLPIFLSQL